MIQIVVSVMSGPSLLLQLRKPRAHLRRMRALDRLENLQRLAQDPDGAPGLAERRIGVAEIVQRNALAAPVAVLPRHDQLLLVELDGASWLAEIGIGVAEIAKRLTLAAPVADL